MNRNDSLNARKLPIEPLQRVVERRLTEMHAEWDGQGANQVGMATFFGKGPRLAYLRARTKGFVSEVVGDRLAHALGMHPADIWDEWFEGC